MSKLYKINVVCADNELRPTMQHILVTNEFIYATDSHVAVIHKVEDIFTDDQRINFPERFLIHKDNWKMFTKAFETMMLNTDLNQFEIVRKNGVVDIIPIYFEDTVGKYPDVDSIFHKMSETSPLQEIGVNPEFLNNLYIGMGLENGAKLSFISANKAILVNNKDGEEYPKGLVMPIMIS